MSGNGQESEENLFVVTECILQTDCCYDGENPRHIVVVCSQDKGIIATQITFHPFTRRKIEVG